MEIIMVSRTMKSLERKNANTSSVIFELDFAKSLSTYAKVSIFSFEAEKNCHSDDVSLYNLDSKKYKTKDFLNIIEKNSVFQEDTKIIVAFGYDYLMFKKLKAISNALNAKLISFTFDTHIAAIENKPTFYKLMVDSYFKLGIKNLNNIDGIILFQKQAYDLMKLKIPYLVSKIGVDKNEIIENVYERNEKKVFKIIYTGSLTSYNGIAEMLTSFTYLRDDFVNLEIYGKGPLENLVREFSENDKRILYGGLLTKEKIDLKVREADLLLNLRDTNNIVSKFSFPSKLLQYLASGIPVMSTQVVKEKKFEDVVFIIDHLNAEEISKKIKYIIDNPEIQKSKVLAMPRYIEENFQWPKIIEDMIDFLERLPKR